MDGPHHPHGHSLTTNTTTRMGTPPPCQSSGTGRMGQVKGDEIWDESTVREYKHALIQADKRRQATGKETHFGRIFPLRVEKNSQQPAHLRKYKGRVVFQGNKVKDERGLAALFADQGSSASMLSTAKLVDYISRLPGCSGEQGDAPSAYTQATLYNSNPENEVVTWIFLPKDQWPEEWHGKYKNPVVRLRLALYGHPL